MQQFNNNAQKRPELFKQLTGADYTPENIENFIKGEIKLKSEQALDGYKEGQDMAADMAVDILSGFAAIGVYTAAVAAAPCTGGASIAIGVAVAGASAAAIKTGLKFADAKVGGREYSTDNLKKDLVTGAFSGVLAPVTGGLGGAVGKTVATKVGIQAVKQVGKEVAETAVESGIKQSLKTALTNPTGYEYIGSTIAKRGLALGSEMATDGALGGAIDNAFRTAYDGGGVNEVAQSAVEGFVGGAIMSPIIGGGMKGAGKAGHSIGSFLAVKKVSKLISYQNVSKNMSQATNIAAQINFDELANTGLTLKYSRKSFAENLKNLVNHFPIEKQKEILKKFNIELIYDANNSFQIKDIPSVPTAKIKDKTELCIMKEIHKFLDENEFATGNAELDKFLNDFIQIVPEFLYTIGKKQHDIHDFTVDVHTLSVLKKSIENPEYAKLAEDDKLVLNLAVMLHDIAKKYVDPKTPDHNHALDSTNKAIEILDKIDLSDETKIRVVKLVSNHEFFANYNDAFRKYKCAVKQNQENISYGLTPRDISEETRYLNSKISNII